MILGLNSTLNFVGISAAKGIDLLTTRDQLDAALPRDKQEAGAKDETGTAAAAASKKEPASAERKLTPEEIRKVEELKQIDREVREHERAHMAVGRSIIIGAADFGYTYGPDGRPYATSGEVSIDTSAEQKPQQNIEKGVLIQRTALAPAEPSPQDFRVAAIGVQLEDRGYADLAREQAQAASERGESRPLAAVESSQRSASIDSRQALDNAYAATENADTAAARLSIYA